MDLREQFFDPYFSIPEIEEAITDDSISKAITIDALARAAYKRHGLRYPEDLSDSITGIAEVGKEMLTDAPYIGYYTALEWYSADLLQRLADSEMLDHPEEMTGDVKTARDIAAIVLVRQSVQYRQEPLSEETVAIFARLGIDVDDLYDTILSGVNYTYPETAKRGAEKLKTLTLGRGWLEVWSNVLSPMMQELMKSTDKAGVLSWR